MAQELKKVAEFYADVEEQLVQRYLPLMSAFRDRVLKAQADETSSGAHSSHPTAATSPARREELVALMSGIVQFYTLLLQLENYAVINVCGFGKILKKHDKLTG